MIAVCPNPYRDNQLELTRSCVSLLQEAGFSAVVCPVFAEPGDDVIPQDLPLAPLSELDEDLSLAVVIGGDGTVLSVVHTIPVRPVPLLGVNLGTMGFMTSLEPEDLVLVVKAARGEYRISSRMMIDITLYRDGEVILRDSALNDAYIHGYGDTIRLHAMCDGQTITAFGGDGIIFSTPTGSTGYSLSAGGPVVEPETDNIIVTPICAHTLLSRSLVFTGEDEVKIEIGRRGRITDDETAEIAFDGGRCFGLRMGDGVIIKRSDDVTRIVRLSKESFLDILSRKMSGVM